TLAGLPGALAELHHATAKTAPDGAQQKAERRRRFALALAGVDDEQPFLDRLAGDLGVLDCLAVGHLGLVARLLVVGFGYHGGILELGLFQNERQSRRDQDRAVGHG